mmetsp:Transcript_69933/g.163593  ORF Transcript_69933/g.163593 Transcript_69933/m.163593 type:complete len:219 (-) Transcript_69933:922-1578(-)
MLSILLPRNKSSGIEHFFSGQGLWRRLGSTWQQLWPPRSWAFQDAAIVVYSIQCWTSSRLRYCSLCGRREAACLFGHPRFPGAGLALLLSTSSFDPAEDVDVHHRPEPGGKRRSTFLFLDLADVQQEHEPGRFGRIGQRRQEVHHLVALHRVQPPLLGREGSQCWPSENQNHSRAELKAGERHVQTNQRSRNDHEEEHHQPTGDDGLVGNQHVADHIV